MGPIDDLKGGAANAARAALQRRQRPKVWQLAASPRVAQLVKDRLKPQVVP